MIDHEDKRSLSITEIMTPQNANFAGNIHGGHILSLLDKVAYSCAARYCQHYVVTLSVNQVIFKEPIHVGELVTFLASINHVGSSSMEVGIKVISENIATGEQRHTNTCYFTMVALDDNHKPCAVKLLSLNTADQKRRFKEAELRKDLRQRYNDEHEALVAKLRKNISEK
jgi:acyl-CoA hydrolase